MHQARTILIKGTMNDNLASFVGGFSLSAFGNVSWIWSLQIFPADAGMAKTYAIAFAVKVFATLFLGVVGGIAGLLGKDIYQGFKKKKNDGINEENQ